MLGEGGAPDQVEDVYLREVQCLLLGWFRKERKSNVWTKTTLSPIDALGPLKLGRAHTIHRVKS